MTEKTLEKGLNSLKKLNKILRHQTGQAISDYNMIEDGDKVMVCFS